MSASVKMATQKTATPRQRPQHFPPAKVDTLLAFYMERGMVGVGKKFQRLIGEASAETGLAEIQIKV